MEEKILACFTCPHIITCVMPSCWQMSISLLSAPSEIQWQRAASGSISGDASSLIADGDHFDAGLARGFQREHREASVAGDQPVRAWLFDESALRRAR